MREVAYIEYNLNIQGLYGWGTGWIREPDPEKPSYPDRWAEMCSKLRENGPSWFKGSLFKPVPKGNSVSVCEEFTSDSFHAYMHPMDIAGHRITSKYCPGEPERVVGELKKNLDELMKIIRETFPEVNITAQLKTRKVVMDLDRCTRENFDM